MTIELDHFLILTGPGAPLAELVCDIGLTEGPRNDHPGQGTANRRFFFSNSALELLYVRDANEAANGRGSRMCIVERANNTDASPFGLIVKETGEPTNVPFPGWRYCPEYFRTDQCFHVGENSGLLEEPLCICMPRNAPLLDAQLKLVNPQMVVTELRISVPVIRPSATLEAVADCDRIALRLNEPHRMEIVFNDAEEGKSIDMTPELPLVIRW